MRVCAAHAPRHHTAVDLWCAVGVWLCPTQEPQYPSGLSYDAVSFMMQALEKNPQKRPTVKQLLAHPWIDKLAQQQQQLPHLQ